MSLRSLALPVALALSALMLTVACSSSDDDIVIGAADIDITMSTPASGNTNISGSGVTVTTSADVINGTPVTRVQVDATTGGLLRRILVSFENATGTPREVSYSWGVSSLNENIVYCPAAGCTGITVNTGAREILFTNTALDNNHPFGAPSKFATIPVGGILYP